MSVKVTVELEDEEVDRLRQWREAGMTNSVEERLLDAIESHARSDA